MLARVIIVALILVTAVARAEEPPKPVEPKPSIDLSQLKDVARAKAEEGLLLYEAGNWAEAYERFKLAEDLFHAPTLVLHMAHCKRELRELRAARELYRKVATEPTTEDAPTAFIEARTEASARVTAMDDAIPHITIEVTGADPTTVRVSLDGEAVAINTEIELDPGTYHVDATAAGVDPIALDFDLVPGTRAAIPLAFKRVMPDPSPSQPVPVRLPQPIEPSPEGSLIPGLVAFGVGAAGLIMGAIAGGIAVSRVEAIKEECDGTSCPERLQGDADEAQTISTISNVGFVVGGVGLIVGTVLVIVRPGGEPGRAAVTIGPTSASLHVTF